MRAPKVSVIVPTHNGGQLLREAVTSALDQTVREIEVIVVEDGTNSATGVLKGLDERVKYFWQENQGVSGARNTAVRHSSAPWLAFLDHDDLWMPSKLERQLELAERDGSLDVIHTDYFALRETGLVPGPRVVPADEVPTGEVLPRLFQNNFLVLSATMITRRAFDAAGGFDSRYLYAQDYDLWLRIALRSRFGWVNDRLAVFRDHDSLSSDHLRALVDCADVLTEFLSVHPDAASVIGGEGVRRRMAAAHWECGYAYFGAGRYTDARVHFLSAWRWDRSNARPLAYAFACLLGPRGVAAVRELKAAIH